MLATILKSKNALNVTFAIIETFTQVRCLKRELVDLHKETDSGKQTAKMRHFGKVLSDIVMPDLETSKIEVFASLLLSIIYILNGRKVIAWIL